MPACAGHCSGECPLRATVGVNKRQCRHCWALDTTAAPMPEPAEGFMWCLGGCGVQVLNRNERCGPCSLGSKKRAFVDHLRDTVHCACAVRDQCDQADWRNWLGSRAAEVEACCSRPIASRKKNREQHGANRCAFCRPPLFHWVALRWLTANNGLHIAGCHCHLPTN